MNFYKNNCPYVHVKGTRRNGNNEKVEITENNTRNKLDEQQNVSNGYNDFLDLFQNFKKEIIETLDIRIATVISQNQVLLKDQEIKAVPTYQYQNQNLIHNQSTPMNLQSYPTANHDQMFIHPNGNQLMMYK